MEERKIDFKTILQLRIIISNLGKHVEEYVDSLDANIKPEQVYILFAIYNIDNVTQEEISYHLGYDRATAGRVLERFETIGFLTRTPDENDNRKKRISLTKKGIESAKRIEKLVNEWYEGVSEGKDMDKVSLKDFAEVLSRNIASDWELNNEKR